ncbi:MAG: metal ABC transporter permease [Armatimonadetes bacterium]|nr:metal ABC transporter permease [Armatimonadota bacterium]
MLEMLKHDFLRHALGAAIIAGASLSFIGVYVILRRIVFVGAALAQLGAAGVGLALLTGQSLLLGAAVAVLAGAFSFVIMPQQERTISRESLLGAAYALASAFALLFVALSPVGEAHISSLLFGDLLAVGHGDMELLAAACLLIVVVHLIAYHAFVAVIVDPTFAHSVGVKECWVNLLFYLSLGALIGACIRAIGALVVFAFLVLPPIAGLIWARSLKFVFIIAIAIASISAILGLWLSFAYDLPAGPAVVAVCGGLTFLAAAIRWLVNFKFR